MLEETRLAHPDILREVQSLSVHKFARRNLVDKGVGGVRPTRCLFGYPLFDPWPFLAATVHHLEDFGGDVGVVGELQAVTFDKTFAGVSL
jgi:hypothetical protein